MSGVKDSDLCFANSSAEGTGGMQGLFCKSIREVTQKRAGRGADANQPFQILPKDVEPGLRQKAIGRLEEVPKRTLREKQSGSMKYPLCAQVRKRRGKALSFTDITFRREGGLTCVPVIASKQAHKPDIAGPPGAGFLSIERPPSSSST